MGMSLEEILDLAEKFKENLWYFVDVRQLTEAQKASIKASMNGILDELEGLE